MVATATGQCLSPVCESTPLPRETDPVTPIGECEWTHTHWDVCATYICSHTWKLRTLRCFYPQWIKPAKNSEVIPVSYTYSSTLIIILANALYVLLPPSLAWWPTFDVGHPYTHLSSSYFLLSFHIPSDPLFSFIPCNTGAIFIFNPQITSSNDVIRREWICKRLLLWCSLHVHKWYVTFTLHTFTHVSCRAALI